MHLKEIGKPDADPVSMDWDQAQAALRSGTYEIHSEGLMEDASTRSEPIVPNIPAAPEVASPDPAVAPVEVRANIKVEGPTPSPATTKGKAA